MSKYNHCTFEEERDDAVEIATQLCYSESVINAINEATTITEINRILHTARNPGENTFKKQYRRSKH